MRNNIVSKSKASVEDLCNTFFIENDDDALTNMKREFNGKCENISEQYVFNICFSIPGVIQNANDVRKKQKPTAKKVTPVEPTTRTSA